MPRPPNAGPSSRPANGSPGGFFVLKDINVENPFLCFCNKIHDLILSGEMGSELTVSQASRELNSLGFKIDSVEKRIMFVYPHYTIISKK